MVRSLELNLKAAMTRTFPRITSNASRTYTIVANIISTSPCGKVGKTCGAGIEVEIRAVGVELLFILPSITSRPTRWLLRFVPWCVYFHLKEETQWNSKKTDLKRSNVIKPQYNWSISVKQLTLVKPLISWVSIQSRHSSQKKTNLKRRIIGFCRLKSWDYVR